MEMADRGLVYHLQPQAERTHEKEPKTKTSAFNAA